MKILFVTPNPPLNLGSTRIRCDWLLPLLAADKYDGTQDVSRYDAVIHQKSFPVNSIRGIQVLDLCDPEWRNNDPVAFRRCLNLCDAVVVPTESLRDDLLEMFRDVRCFVIPDRHDLESYRPHSKSPGQKQNPPSLVWFGYASHFERARELIEEALRRNYAVTILSDKDVGIGRFVPWDDSVWMDELAKHDICLNPLGTSGIKPSNHKHVTAWALGLTVAETIAEIESGGVTSPPLDQYDIRHSADEWRWLLEVLTPARPVTERPKVFAVTCTGDGWLNKLVVMAWARILKDARYETRLSFPVHRPFENALAHAVVEFLESDAEWFLNIDSDNPPTANPLELTLLNKDVIGVATPVYHNDASKPGNRPYYLNAYQWSEGDGAYKEYRPQEGIQQVDAVGTGCILIARRVLEDVVMRQAPFQRTTDSSGRVEFGNDLNFCRRAKERGFEIWCDFRSPCQHFAEIELLEAIKAFNGMKVR